MSECRKELCHSFRSPLMKARESSLEVMGLRSRNILRRIDFQPE